MARVALLIGVGEYDTAAGLPSLPAAEKDVRSWQQVLENPELGGFDQVTTLLHPTQADMAEAIETWFGGHTKEDLALLFISGHGVKDEESKLYFAASTTRKQGERLIRSTAVAASSVRDFMRQSRAKRQVVILDCCFSGAFGDLLSKDSGLVEFQELLEDPVEAEGRVVMTSSSSIEYSFAPTDGELSIYSRYLLEGIRTGAADQDGDGAITVDELHGFASRKVKEAAPAMTPKIIVLRDEGYRVRIAKAPLGDPKVKYRKEVETLAARRQGNLSPVNRRALNVLRQELKLPENEATQILEQVLQPFREFQAKIQEFENALREALEFDPQFGADTVEDLQHLQQVLKLRDEDVEAIAAQWNITLSHPAITDEVIEAIAASMKATYPLIQNSEFQAQDSEDDLRSEKGIDYTRLRDLLKAQDWKAADRETYEAMIRVVGKESGQWFSKQELLDFPCADLRTIDSLWVKYSQGRFGFSVQKKIYVECGAKLDSNYHSDEIWEKFGDRVGWRQGGVWLLYSDMDPSLASSQGFFPLRGGSGQGLGEKFSSLAWRLENFSAKQS